LMGRSKRAEAIAYRRFFSNKPTEGLKMPLKALNALERISQSLESYLYTFSKKVL